MKHDPTSPAERRDQASTSSSESSPELSPALSSNEVPASTAHRETQQQAEPIELGEGEQAGEEEKPALGFGNVHHIRHAGKDIYIIGTAHVSKKSVEEVSEVIRALRPDTVCIELDAMRYEAITDKGRWSKLDVFQVIRQKRVLYLLSSMALTAYQRRMADQLGIEPGAEMKAAIHVAEEVGATLILADRDIQATLKRTWHGLGLWQRLQLVGGLLESAFSSKTIEEADIEALKDRDTLSDAMKAFAAHFPSIQQPLIDERDRYLIASVREAPGQCIVAVVGAGHVEGMTRYLDTPVDKKALSEIPVPNPWWGSLKWIIPAAVLVSVYVGYRDHEGEAWIEMLNAWVLPNALFAGLMGIIALAHPLTVLVAMVASPITSLSPLIGVGMVTGLLEAWLRKPTVEDCEQVGTDILSVGGLYRNRFLRVLLVTVLTSAGSAIGALVGVSWLFAML